MNPAGRMVGFPMDTGPTATFFRNDLLEKAGLPHDPDTVAKVIGSWADFIAFGAEIKKAVKGAS